MANSTSPSVSQTLLDEPKVGSCYLFLSGQLRSPGSSCEAVGKSDLVEIIYITLLVTIAAYFVHNTINNSKSNDKSSIEVRNEDMEGYDENIYWDAMARKYELRFGKKSVQSVENK